MEDYKDVSTVTVLTMTKAVNGHDWKYPQDEHFFNLRQSLHGKQQNKINIKNA